MVKHLAASEKVKIAAAVHDAEEKTCAEIVVVVAPASDAYQSFIVLYGLLLGSLLAFYLWVTGIAPDFPILLAVQAAAISLLTFMPWLHQLCLRLVPKATQRRRAARRACEEYMTVTAHAGAATPVVLLYISQAERYVHIMHSRSVAEKLPTEHWQSAVGMLTAGIRADGLATACIKAVGHIGASLAASFPPAARRHAVLDNLREITPDQ